MRTKPRLFAFCRSIAFALLAAAPGCDKQDAPPEKPAAATRPEPAAAARAASAGDHEHAASGVKPGSHEDWCGEHGVPESMCTRCNPSLVPAFKATGDWCAEHGLPESQCLKCNPKLEIVRPPKSG